MFVLELEFFEDIDQRFSIYVDSKVLHCLLLSSTVIPDNNSHERTYELFYPPDLELKGRENFLSSVDVTLGNPNFDREFKITVTYNDDDKSLLDHIQGTEISPDNYLLQLHDFKLNFYMNVG